MKFVRRILCFCLAFLLTIGWSIATTHQAQSRQIFSPNHPAIVADVSIPVVAVIQLPPEVMTTIRLIDQGGPFPYTKDGTTFNNRERLLPLAPKGYYREYTVPTPGVRGRGARRLVTGKRKEFYYTGDHYRSFVRVKR